MAAKIQVGDDLPIDGVEVIKIVASDGVSASVALEDEKAVVTILGSGDEDAAVVAANLAAHIADTSDAHDASAISILDSAADFTATDVEGALAEIQVDIEALQAATSGLLISRSLSFAETAGAGTYTGTLALPAGAVLSSVVWETTAAWDADTTVLDAGFTGTLTAYGNDIDVDGAGGDQIFGLDTEDSDDFPAGTNFVASIVTTGTGGTTGRTRVTIVYSVPPAATAAVKS